MTDSSAYAGTPRWAKAFGGILIVLALLFVVLHLTDTRGRHGPGRHLPSAQDTPVDMQEHRPSPGAQPPPAPDR